MDIFQNGYIPLFLPKAWEDFSVVFIMRTFYGAPGSKTHRSTALPCTARLGCQVIPIKLLYTQHPETHQSLFWCFWQWLLLPVTCDSLLFTHMSVVWGDNFPRSLTSVVNLRRVLDFVSFFLIMRMRVTASKPTVR